MKRNNEQDRDRNVAGNNPSKPMDSKREVEQFPDPKTDQDFPGYPHYPANEDIMDKRTDSHRVDVDVENFAGGQNALSLNRRYAAEHDRPQEQKEKVRISGGESEIPESEDVKNDEIGVPQNISEEDLRKKDNPGTDIGRSSGNK